MKFIDILDDIDGSSMLGLVNQLRSNNSCLILKVLSPFFKKAESRLSI